LGGGGYTNQKFTKISRVVNTVAPTAEVQISTVRNSKKQLTIPPVMNLALVLLPLAAAGYSMLYLLLGGGLGGAVIIFIVAKLLGK
jgi:hypothetical protein